MTRRIPATTGLLCAFALCAAALSGCGSSATPTATPTPTTPPTTVPARHPSAVRLTVRRFMTAYLHNRRRAVLALMGPGLLARNRHEFVSQMLGVDGPIGAFYIVRVKRFRSKSGGWARVTVRLTLDHGASRDLLVVRHLRGGWRLAAIRQKSTST